MVALYGNVAIERALCPECQHVGFVLDGRTVCCGMSPNDRPQIYKQFSEPARRRRHPSKGLREQLLREQKGLCLYCDREFGSYYQFGTHQVLVRIVWDHMVPLAWRSQNGDRNFAAACARCNGWKADRLFDTVQDARDYLGEKWTRYLQRGMRVRDAIRFTRLLDVAPEVAAS
jgi:hypothetical protein